MSEHDETTPPSDDRSKQPPDETVDSGGAPSHDDDATKTHEPSSDALGQQIGPYRVLEELGEGGMGSVYLAEQREPVRRRVALKIIKAGMDTGQVIARFEAERQALAMMDHNNIAKVHDAGTTDSGRPYFVMELVEGKPITKFCDDHKLGINERLEIFRQVCSAVQHAHQKGIIHRDLKPSNVLVTMQDDQPVPKVIDFGLAKATGQQLTEKTMFTAQGQVLGTLEYMSPEQANLNDLDVDTRSDIYSLGVILYELLTGSTPLTRESLKRAAFMEILKRIKEEEPERPSSRISHSTDSAEFISSVRQVEPRRLLSLMKGELDWIAVTALEKERTRRYESAATLADDIQRFLNGDAVEARPPSFGYQLSKLVNKHRSKFVAAVIVFLCIFFGLIGTGVMWWRANNLAVDNSRLANENAEKARLAKLAETESEAIRREVNNFSVDSNFRQGGRVAYGEGNDVVIVHPANYKKRERERLTGGHQAYVYCVTFDGLGERIASGAEDGSVVVWNTQNGSILHKFTGHNDVVNCIAFDKTGESLVTGSSDGTIKIWNLSTGKLDNVLIHDAPVSRVAFCGGDRDVMWRDSAGNMQIRDRDGRILTYFDKHLDIDDLDSEL